MTSENMIKASAACLLEHCRSPISQPTREAEKGCATPGWICCILFASLCYMNLYDWRTGYLQTTLAYDPLGWPRWPLPSPWISVVWHLQRWVKSKAACALNNLTSHCLVDSFFMSIVWNWLISADVRNYAECKSASQAIKRRPKASRAWLLDSQTASNC